VDTLQNARGVGDYVFDARVAYLHTDNPHYIRVSKNIPTLKKLFREVHYIGCSRFKRWSAEDGLPGVHYHISDRILPQGISAQHAVYLKEVRDRLRNIQPDVVLATNEEITIPFVVGYFPRPKVLVMDLIDSIGIRMVGRMRHLNPVWQSFSALTRANVDGLVEMTDERLQRHSIKPKICSVIFNSPEWRAVEPRPDLPAKFIFASGTASDRNSGYETLLAAVERVPELKIVFAGRPVGPWLNETFLTHPQVLNLGEVSPLEALRITASSTALFGFYRPEVLNYIYAPPNKIFDAMMTGVPMLINSECKASDFAIKHGFGFTAPFGEPEKLERVLRELMQDRPSIKESCRVAQQEFRAHFAWQHMERRWLELFERLNVKKRIG
jgi:glycosyltransferase involved in cell wall biosynthesis